MNEELTENEDVGSTQVKFDGRYKAFMDEFLLLCDKHSATITAGVVLIQDKECPDVVGYVSAGHKYSVAKMMATILRGLKNSIAHDLR